MKFLLFLLIIPISLACVVPKEGMIVRESVEFCSDVFYMSEGPVIKGSGIEVICKGTVLKSWKGGTGISVENSNNVSVKGCRLTGFDIGFEILNATLVVLSDNHLLKNKIGVRFGKVSRSATFNQDVSLSSAFIVSESEKNALSLTNKFVTGGFCENNYCNIHRDAALLAATPKLSRAGMSVWFAGQFDKKSKSRLQSWAFGNLFQ